MHYFGYDARGLHRHADADAGPDRHRTVVGAVVSERKQTADALRRVAEEHAAREGNRSRVAPRASVWSAEWRSALAHEINQPMTAARALARSAQHLIDKPDTRPAARQRQHRQCHRPDRSCERRDAAHARFPAARPSACLDASRSRPMIEDALTLARPDAKRARHRDHIRYSRRTADGAWRSDPDRAGGAEPDPQCHRGDFQRGAKAMARSGLPQRSCLPSRIEIACATTARASRHHLRKRMFEPMTTSQARRVWASAFRSA